METAAARRSDFEGSDRTPPPRDAASNRRGYPPRARGSTNPPGTTVLHSPHDLPTLYRNRASQLLRYAPAAAEAFIEAAELLEAALIAADAEFLTPKQIEHEGLCSAETVRRHVRQRKVENVGTTGRIQIRRADAPSNGKKRTFAQLTREVARSSRNG
jgi:hypothetical protein